MKAKCKYGGQETTWPCSARNCPLFGDCLTKYEKIVAKPMTNADRIRAISYEKLAKLLTHATADGCPPDMNWDCAKEEYGWDACDACWERWLQQPAEMSLVERV